MPTPDQASPAYEQAMPEESVLPNAPLTVILMLSKAPSLRYFAFVADLMQKNTGFQPVFWGSRDQIADLVKLGVRAGSWIDFSSCSARPIDQLPTSAPEMAQKTQSPGTPTLLQRMRAYAAGERTLAMKVLLHVLSIVRFRRKSARIINNLKPHTVCVWGDNGGLTNGDFLRLCNRKGVKVIHCPIALSQQEVIAELRMPHRRCIASGPSAHRFAPLVARAFPNQVFRYKGTLLFYHTLDEILAMVLTGSLTPRPWILGMSRADMVLLASTAEKEYWVERGLLPEKTSVIGYYELDAVRDQARLAPASQVDARQVIVYNAPNFAEHNIYTWERHWEIIGAHAEKLRNTGCDLILVLHPKSAVKDYEWLESRYGCRIHKGPTANALLHCSMYVSVGSTTGLWAASLGIRVLDLSKVFGFELPVLEKNSRITIIESEAEFGEVLQSAFEKGKRLKDDDWYIEPATRADFLAKPLVGTSLLEHIVAADTEIAERHQSSW